MPALRPERNADVERLSARLGIETRYRGQSGAWHQVPPDTLRALNATLGAPTGQRDALPRSVVIPAGRRVVVPLRLPAVARRLRWDLTEEGGTQHRGEIRARDVGPRLDLPFSLLPGYHRLDISWSGSGNGDRASTMLIAVPRRAYIPPRLRDGKVWGLAAQLYGLRSERNWGIGDFTDLEALIAGAAAAGADVVGINPLHALFPDEPERASPYSPSSRLFINPLYLDLSAMDDFAECPPAQRLAASPAVTAARRQVQHRVLVDYTAVTRLKRRVLELLYESFCARHLHRPGDKRATEFRSYQCQHGEPLRRFAAFHALRETLTAKHGRRPWRRWPAEFRNPDSPAIADFTRRHIRQIEFIEYQQWQASRQLARAACSAGDAAMAVGLYQDLAVGFDPDGADAWSFQDMIAESWNIGAPPDAWSPKGQDWGLSPLNPRRLRETGYGPFIETLRASMRYAGALRIDHILGLKRLFWVPHGGSPADGAYVRYPFSDLMGIIALESARQRCVVVGEDLGTVPPGFSEELRRRGMLTYRLLYFSRTAQGGFEAPRRYPRQALAAITTHDLPTIAGYWRGDDIALRERLKLYPEPGQARRDRSTRVADRRALLAAFAAEGLPVRSGEIPVDAAHRFLARTPARIAMVQAEDLLGLHEQVNMPGTVDQHPNWRRKLPVNVDALFRDARVRQHVAALAAERPRPTAGVPPPRATYRLQLNRDFPFDAATDALPYLARLGISHVYLSPIFEAQEDSTHGYDTTSFERLSPELGGEEGFRRLADTARALGLKIVVDFVPNHMGIGRARNTWWLDLLEWGRLSPAAEVFDIDWTPAAWPELRHKLTVPLLGDTYENVRDRGELGVRFDARTGAFAVWYHEHCFPLRPADYSMLLSAAAERLRSTRQGRPAATLSRLANAFGRVRDSDRANRLKAELARWVAIDRRAMQVVQATATAMASKSHSIGPFDDLMRRQVYRLDIWRTAGRRINYRRFFDINQLASLRMERRNVFERCHRVIAHLVADDMVHGLRLDHVDGLYDPADYCRRLRRLIGRQGRHLPIFVEKILAADEALRRDWPVQGTTGYEFANWINGLLVDGTAAAKLADVNRRFTGRHIGFGQELRDAKRQIAEQLFGGELTALAARIACLPAPQRYDRKALVAALRDVIGEFPIYRTYIGRGGPAAEDRRTIIQAVKRAHRHRAHNVRLLGFVRSVLTTGLADRSPARQAAEIRDIAMRFQQLTAPVQAKALEDTAFYRYGRLLSLNEVGGDPNRFGLSVAEFHARMRQRVREWPLSLLATATHDTKRGEDARARISVLSEIPERWRKHVARWAALNRAAVGGAGNQRAPSANDEYLIYQALLGAWPMELTDGRTIDGAGLRELRGRMTAFIQKAVREAKLRSSWIAPDVDYEKACQSFIERLLDPVRSPAFLGDFAAFAAEIARCGALNSLSQTALKLLVPGVPDIYRGCELWDLSLVDPDNRRPVSLTDRQWLLADFAANGRSTDGRELSADWRSGRIKLYLTWRLLTLRRAQPSLFASGSYEPLRSTGPAAKHVIAFRRRHKRTGLVVAVGRWFAGFPAAPGALCPRPEVWRGTSITGAADGRAPGIDVLTGRAALPGPNGRLRVDELFRDLPIAVISAS